MELLLLISILLFSYVVIQLAIDRSINTKLLKENYKVLVEIRQLLKDKNENI